MRRRNIPFIIIIVFFSFLFFYKLDYQTLGSWDEAWYGSIARQMSRTGDLITMVWNGKPFYDHPPMAIWFMAISYKILGINETSTRLPSVILGIFSLFLIYKIAVSLFHNQFIGWATSIILGSSVWYLIRVRSGNLDSIFVFFFLLTVFSALKSRNNTKWFIFTGISFACLVLSKTLVGFSVLPLIIITNYKQILLIKTNYRKIVLAVLIFLFITGIWYCPSAKNFPGFFKYHFFNIGARNKSLSSFFILKPQLPLFYLHMGIRKWYYFWLVGLIYIILSGRFLQKKFFFLIFWTIITFYPFLTSEKTEIWHLIPVYLPIVLTTSSGLHQAVSDIIFFIMPKFTSRLSSLIFLGLIILVSLIQIKIFIPEIYPKTKYTPDDVAIAKAVKKYSQRIILDDDFLPIAVFYSDRHILPLNAFSYNKQTLVKLFKSDEKNFVVITRNLAVDELKKENIEYKELEKNNTYSIVSR